MYKFILDTWSHKIWINFHGTCIVWSSVQGWLRLVSQYIHRFNAKLTQGTKSCCLAGRAKNQTLRNGCITLFPY